ncbi:MAG: hypothetical protein WC362_07295 [Methanoregula sp.]|jgi:hypothetical protein
MTGKTARTKQVLLIAVIVVLVVLSGCAGCIKNAQHLMEGGGSTADPVPSVGETEIPTVVPVTPTPIPVPVITPAKSEIVTEVSPILTPDPYVIQHAARINQTPQYAFLYRQPEFTKTYTLTGNAYGLLVNVVQGPLYIKYIVNPKYDCLDDPDSCRGTVLVPVNNPYMTITVRDNQTQEVVAKDGYGREYSSDTGNYHFTITSDSSDSTDTGTFNSEPGPRYIPVYREGQFQITTQGNYLDVTVSIITGTSPDPLDTTKNSAGTASVPSNEDDWE